MFQKTIISKYLKAQNTEQLLAKWEIFQAHFHHAEIQENIRNSKEEQYQGEFLIDLFVNVFGYIKNPTPNFNLTTEYKNVKDSKKADGAIVINEKVSTIIELKGTNTTDLSKIEEQAFGYKNNQPDCKYIVTSNFEKLRFYIDNAIEHLEFNLFELNFDQFQLLYLCLAYENIYRDIPVKMKAESLSQEDVITKKLYKDYSVFKRALFQNLVVQNPEYEALELFKKSQKLLDRLLFLFFGEDRGLLPPNSVRLILEQWKKLQDLDEYVPLYDRFKKYFGYLNTGFKGKQFDVFAYNGGLFKPDEVLDNILIDDELLYEHSLKLSEYDFASEVDVNILGHIFENSLNEIDEIKAQLEGQEIDKSKTKRKKDGVFYTPKYITKYIVENTVGKICEDKKAEIGIVEEDYFTDKKRQQKTKLQLLQKLQDYRTWLHQITIVDPACGSGAFLNEALNFLIAEHHYIDELEAKLTGSSIAFAYHSDSILEHNLFGVDLNEESVEIAKLSLWLRTAEPNRKLNSLNDNIKCGNSLIDDPEVAGEKAFNWEQEFPQVFAKGGFDVVIGNPPYVNMTKNNTNEDWLNFYIKEYKSIRMANSKNLYTLFNEIGAILLKENGIMSFIIPEGFLKTRSYIDCVKALSEKGKITKAVYFEDWVFEDATTGSMIFEFVKNTRIDISIQNYFFSKNKQINLLEERTNKVIEKYHELDFPKMSEIMETFKGMVIKDRKEVISDEPTEDNEDIFLLGNCIDRYLFKNRFYFNYENATIIGGTKTKEKYQVIPRILIRRTGNYLCCILLENIAYTESTLYSSSLISDEFDIKYILAVLNSKLLSYVVKQNLITNEQAFPQILMTDLELLKISKISLSAQQPFIAKADQMLSLNKELQEVSGKFLRNLQREFSLEKFSKKLENWYDHSYADFLKELKKLKVELSLSQKAEWEDYFLQEQKKAQDLQSRIQATDKEIDQMVYELYGLTAEEIEIVEKN